METIAGNLIAVTCNNDQFIRFYEGRHVAALSACKYLYSADDLNQLLKERGKEISSLKFKIRIVAAV